MAAEKTVHQKPATEAVVKQNTPTENMKKRQLLFHCWLVSGVGE